MKNNDYLLKYLNIAPFALGLWRAPEAETIYRAYASVQKRKNKRNSKKLAFKKPVLDVGCGFGEFAGVFFDAQVEMGIDISIDDLLKAEQGRKYKNLRAADARKMPFKNNSFSTVISVSVLEHIAHPEQCFSEIYRVLKKGGLLIFSVPTSELNRYLFYPQLFRTLRLEKLAFLYLKNYHKVFKHINILPPAAWKKMATDVGFKIVHTEGTFTSAVVKAFDLFLITALPSQLARWLIGSRWVWALGLKKEVLPPLYNYLTHSGQLTQSNIVIIAQK